WVVGRRHLDRAGAELGVNPIVGDNGDLPVPERQHHVAADEVLVAGVFRVHRDRGVAQHRFGPGGGHGDVAVAAQQRVADVVQLAVPLFVLHFDVRQGGGAGRTPVDDIVALVDQAPLKEVHE